HQLPPAISTLPLGSRVAVGEMRGSSVEVFSILNPASVSTTAAVAALEGSANERAVTWKGPPLVGAVYTPPTVIVPPAGPSSTVQVTSFTIVPATTAVNCRCRPRGTAAVKGMETLTALTVTSAVENLLGSATLVAITCTSIAAAGAVYRPAWLID